MEDFLGPLVTLAIILFQVFNFLKQASANREPDKQPALPKATRSTDSEPVSRGPAGRPAPPALDPRLQAVLAQQLAASVQIVAQGEALATDLPQTLKQIGGLGPSERVLVEVGRDRLLPELRDALPDARALRDRLQQAGPADALALLRDTTAFASLERLDRVRRQVAVLQQLAAWKADPTLSRHLADADAIAASLLEPIQRLAGVEGFAFARQRPICAPTDPNHESLWLGLLPEGYPVIFVPDDFTDDLYRQASVAHEVGHLILLRVPGFADELRDVTGLRSHGPLLEWDGQRLHGSLAWPYSAWLMEVLADAFTALLLGPAALRGLIHSFQRPDDIDAVVVAGIAPGGETYGEHPPAHLRIHLMGDLLERMGFDQEAKALVADWDALHGDAEVIALPTRNGRLVSLPLSQVEEYGRQVLLRFYETAFESLDGKTVEDLPFLEMSPGLWARVQRRAAQLLRGDSFHEDGRIALAAAIEARAQKPQAAPLIARGLMRAVLGRDAEERHAQDDHYALKPRRRAPAAPGRLAHEVRDALLLAEVLPPRGRFARR